MTEYNSGERVELIIKDYSGAKIDIFRWSVTDKNTEKKIFYIIKKKYGIFRVEHDANKDLGWLKHKHDF